MVLGHSSPKIYSQSEVVVVSVNKQVEIYRGCLSSGFVSEKLVKNVQRINKMYFDTQNYSFEHFLFLLCFWSVTVFTTNHKVRFWCLGIYDMSRDS